MPVIGAACARVVTLNAMTVQCRNACSCAAFHPGKGQDRQHGIAKVASCVVRLKYFDKKRRIELWHGD
jgi:hypothetical protein